MAGDNKISQEKLNDTLSFIVKLLNDNNINNWFVAYGTLLGIIRECSCISSDDDIDIICNKDDYDLIKNILTENGISVEHTLHTRGKKFVNSKDILKTIASNEYATVDFYMADIDDKGNFMDNWEDVMWSGCYMDNKLLEKEWRNNIIYVPNNYEIKLVNRYGENWKIPQNNKGPRPKKKII